MIERIAADSKNQNLNAWQKISNNKNNNHKNRVKSDNNKIKQNNNTNNNNKNQTKASAPKKQQPKTNVTTTTISQPPTVKPKAIAAQQEQQKQQQTPNRLNAINNCTVDVKAKANGATVKQKSNNNIHNNKNNKLNNNFNRRRKQEIRQLKRAHRHLLTSGGNAKPKTEVVKKKSMQTNSTIGETTCKKHGNKQRKQQQNKQNQKKKSRRDSLISWSSIEEQLEYLEKLLFCDEQYLQDTVELGHIAAVYNYVDNREEVKEDTSKEQEGDECGYYWSDEEMSTPTPHSDDSQSTTSGAGSCSTYSLTPTSLKRRGHQHHPRFAGARRPNVPNVQEILAALYRGDSQSALSNLRNASETASCISNADTSSTLDDTYSQFTDEQDVDIEDGDGDGDGALSKKSTLNLPLSDSITNSLGSNSPTPTDDSSMVDEGVVSAQTPTAINTMDVSNENSTTNLTTIKGSSKKSKRDKERSTEKTSDRKKRARKDKSNKRTSVNLDASGSTADEGIAVDEDDTQAAEWAKLRCTSEAAEIVAERETRRRGTQRCADYPGLAFGRSIFSSDTMMKFNIIRNELHNIMKTQLKRVIK